MKRRLTNAYDSMTMPDGCSNTIERKLTEQLEARKTGTHIRTMAPSPARRRGWALGAAVCLMLVLSVGGSMLFLGMSGAEMGRQKETIETEAAATPEDHYAQVTDIPAVQVEAFAKVVRYIMLQKNWAALEERIHFPLTVQEEEIQDWQGFLSWMNDYSLYSPSWKKLEEETCTAMFCNWQGIRMADGFLWINEVEGELKITAIQVEEQEEAVETNVPDVFADVLAGNAVYFYGGNYGPRTLEEYCTGLWGSVMVDCFAVVDMDQDGICEVIVSVQTAEAETRVHLVLRQDGKYVCGYPFRAGEMTELKKDGSFFSGDREHRLVFNDQSSWITLEVLGIQQDQPMAQWHSLPCVRPEVILEYYKYAGTGQSRMPSTTYYTFESLAKGTADNDWTRLKEDLTRMGMVCLEDEGTISVFDPDAPGTCLYGTLTNENGLVQLADVGYYICTEEKEYAAEVRQLLSGAPEYWEDAHLPALGSMGRRVFTPEELLAYLS